VTSSGERSYQVHLDSLLGFARDLENDLGGLIRIGDDLDVLRSGTADIAALGDFPEAHWLMDRHQRALNDFDELIKEVSDTVDFGHAVTTEVATDYAAVDDDVANSFSGIARGLSSGGYV
jgi:hypothetical protein